MKAVLDTNAYVDFAMGQPDVVDLLAVQSTEILLPAVVMGKLFYGFRHVFGFGGRGFGGRFWGTVMFSCVS